jgi:hypothetical protein
LLNLSLYVRQRFRSKVRSVFTGLPDLFAHFYHLGFQPAKLGTSVIHELSEPHYLLSDAQRRVDHMRDPPNRNTVPPESRA